MKNFSASFSFRALYIGGVSFLSRSIKKKKLFTLIIAFCLLVGIGCSGSYNEEQINNVRQVSPNMCVAMTVPGKAHAADNIRSKMISLMEQQDRDVPLDVCVYGLDDEPSPELIITFDLR